MKIALSLAAVSAAVALIGSAAAQQQNPPEVRRVVTKIDSSGKAVVMLDGKVQLTSFRSPNPASEMWVTEQSPQPPELIVHKRVHRIENQRPHGRVLAK